MWNNTTINFLINHIDWLFKLIEQIQKYKPIPGLEITFSWNTGSFPGVGCCLFLKITFFNNGISKIRIADLKFADVTPLLKIHPLADYVRKGNYHPLKFVCKDRSYALREITIDTNKREVTGVPLADNYTEDNIKTLIGGLNSFKGKPKETRYFNLKLTVSIGNNKPQEKIFRY